MSISARSKRFGSPSVFYRLQTLILISQKSNHTFAGNGGKARFYPESGSDSEPDPRFIDIKTWKTVDSRRFGIYGSMISSSSWLVLKVLQSKGFEAYLVGGCVRDLILRRTPKDFDVITTAQLKQIKKQFHRSHIVGRRFPICLVNIKGSVIEVSSFDTVAKHDKDKKTLQFSQMPSGCSKKDFILWKNCLSRDFTINSLFYDPFLNKIYDYADGMRDLSLFKVRTVIPAQFSFKEDCARILRGLRIAARLGLSFHKETVTAIRNLSSSIKCLAKSRLMLEVNYMLSYGAAEASLGLLRRFELLEILLPFHAAYLAHEAPNHSAQSSLMLMKLFSSADKVLACDRPSDCSLWVGLLSFHMALVNNPQDALVIWTFSSLLYHGNWTEAVTFARETAQLDIRFVPEILESHGTASDEALVEKVARLASLVVSSIDALTDPESRFQSMARYPIPSTGLGFVSKKVGQHVASLFDVLMGDIEADINQRESFEINYELLGQGNKNETRFVLGKVIMDAMSSGVIIQEKHQEVVVEKKFLAEPNLQQQEAVKNEKSGEIVKVKLRQPVSDLGRHQQQVVKKGKHHQSQSTLEPCEKDKWHQSSSNQDQQLKMVEEKLMIKEKQCQPVSDPGKHQQAVKKLKNHHQPSSDEEQQQEPNKKAKYHLSISNQKQQEEVVNDENVGKHHRSLSSLEQKQGPNNKDKCQQSVSNQEKEQEVDKEKLKYQKPLSSLFSKDKRQQSVSNQEKEQEVDKEKVKCRKPLSSLFSVN